MMNRNSRTGVKSRLENLYVNSATSGKFTEENSRAMFQLYDLARNSGRSHTKRVELINEKLSELNLTRSETAYAGKILNTLYDHVNKNNRIKNKETALERNIETRRTTFNSAPQNTTPIIKQGSPIIFEKTVSISASQYSDLETSPLNREEVIARIDSKGSTILSPEFSEKGNVANSNYEEIVTSPRTRQDISSRTGFKRKVGMALATLALAGCTYFSPVKDKVVGLFQRDQDTVQSDQELPTATPKRIHNEGTLTRAFNRISPFSMFERSLEDKFSSNAPTTQPSASSILRDTEKTSQRATTQPATSQPSSPNVNISDDNCIVPISSSEYTNLSPAPKTLEGSEAIYFSPIPLCSNNSQSSISSAQITQMRESYEGRISSLETQLAQERIETLSALELMQTQLTSDLINQGTAYELQIAELNSDNNSEKANINMIPKNQSYIDPQTPLTTVVPTTQEDNYTPDEFDLLPDSFAHIPAAPALVSERPEISSVGGLETEIIVQPNPTEWNIGSDLGLYVAHTQRRAPVNPVENFENMGRYLNSAGQNLSQIFNDSDRAQELRENDGLRNIIPNLRTAGRSIIAIPGEVPNYLFHEELSLPEKIVTTSAGIVNRSINGAIDVLNFPTLGLADNILHPLGNAYQNIVQGAGSGASGTVRGIESVLEIPKEEERKGKGIIGAIANVPLIPIRFLTNVFSGEGNQQARTPEAHLEVSEDKGRIMTTVEEGAAAALFGYGISQSVSSPDTSSNPINEVIGGETGGPGGQGLLGGEIIGAGGM